MSSARINIVRLRTIAPNETKSLRELMCRPQRLVLIDLAAAGCDCSRPNRKSFQQRRFARSIFAYQKCHSRTELESFQVAKQRQRPRKCIVRNHSRAAVDGREEQIIHASLSTLVDCTHLKHHLNLMRWWRRRVVFISAHCRRRREPRLLRRPYSLVAAAGCPHTIRLLRGKYPLLDEPGTVERHALIPKRFRAKQLH